MNHKRSKHAKKQRAPIDQLNQNEPRRPVVFCTEDIERLVLDSCRAQLISKVIGRDAYPREFTSYFHGSRTSEPKYSITSHRLPAPIPSKRRALSVYPTMTQDLHWNRDSNALSQMHMVEDQKYNCRCENCTSTSCPSKPLTSLDISRRDRVRDNIVTYVNQQTMTPQLIDASCGNLAIPYIPDTIDVAITASDVTVQPVKDTAYVCDRQRYSLCPEYIAYPRCIPIIKRHPYDDNYEGQKRQYPMPCDPHQEAERDTDFGEYYCQPETPKYYHKLKRPTSQCRYGESVCPPDANRRILYNEGISDEITDTFPLPSEKRTSQNDVRGSATKWNKCYIDIDDGIPFAHRSKSKYHNNCIHSKVSNPCNPVRLEPEVTRPIVDCPRLVGKSYSKKPSGKSPCIMLPRKLLSSERDIETFIRNNRGCEPWNNCTDR